MGTAAQSKRDSQAKRTFWFSLAGAITAGLSFCVALAALSYTIHHDKTSGSSFDARLGIRDERLGRLETGLRIVAASVAPQLQHELDESLKAALQKSSSSLPQQLLRFKQETASLRMLKVPLSPLQSRETGETLAEATKIHGELVQTWEAVAEYVSYRSNAPTEPSNLPSCFSLEDHHLSNSFSIQSYSDCVLDLSDLVGAEMHTVRISQRHPDGSVALGVMVTKIHLTRGVVVYRGGALIKLDTLVCDQCAFDFRPTAQVPPPAGRRLGERLLIADLGREVSLERDNFGD